MPPPASSRPAVTVDLVWQEKMRFLARVGSVELALDGDGQKGPSPVQSLACALVGCMASDVVHILTKGRFPLQGLQAQLQGRRDEEEPRRFVSLDLRFVVTGDVPSDKVERAIALSREKYCSVWHSLRQDIAFTTSYEVRAPRA